MTEIFWSKDFSILFQRDKLKIFFPTQTMSLNEKLNAIVRLCFYIGTVLYILSHKYQYLYIPILALGVTYMLHKEEEKQTEENLVISEGTTLPTLDNPFQNVNLLASNEERNSFKAVPSWNNPKVAKMQEAFFSHGLYKDVNDLYGRNNNERQFFSSPVGRELMNDQTGFAKWCFSGLSRPTCKENTLECSGLFSGMV